MKKTSVFVVFWSILELKKDIKGQHNWKGPWRETSKEEIVRWSLKECCSGKEMKVWLKNKYAVLCKWIQMNGMFDVWWSKTSGDGSWPRRNGREGDRLWLHLPLLRTGKELAVKLERVDSKHPMLLYEVSWCWFSRIPRSNDLGSNNFRIMSNPFGGQEDWLDLTRPSFWNTWRARRASRLPGFLECSNGNEHSGRINWGDGFGRKPHWPHSEKKNIYIYIYSGILFRCVLIIYIYIIIYYIYIIIYITWRIRVSIGFVPKVWRFWLTSIDSCDCWGLFFGFARPGGISGDVGRSRLRQPMSKNM